MKTNEQPADLSSPPRFQTPPLPCDAPDFPFTAAPLQPPGALPVQILKFSQSEAWKSKLRDQKKSLVPDCYVSISISISISIAVRAEKTMIKQMHICVVVQGPPRSWRISMTLSYTDSYTNCKQRAMTLASEGAGLFIIIDGVARLRGRLTPPNHLHHKPPELWGYRKGAALQKFALFSSS